MANFPAWRAFFNEVVREYGDLREHLRALQGLEPSQMRPEACN